MHVGACLARSSGRCPLSVPSPEAGSGSRAGLRRGVVDIVTRHPPGGEISPRQASDRIDELLQWTGDVVWRPILARWPHLREVPTAIVPVGEVAALPVFTALVDGRRPALAWTSPSHRRRGPSCSPMSIRKRSAAARWWPPTRQPATRRYSWRSGKLSPSATCTACRRSCSTLRPTDTAPRGTILAEDLRAGSLIVLSACDLAGFGSGAPAEQLGFPAVLLAGGARSVVAALWPVPDSRKTVRLMTDFHRRLETAETPRGARCCHCAGPHDGCSIVGVGSLQSLRRIARRPDGDLTVTAGPL